MGWAAKHGDMDVEGLRNPQEYHTISLRSGSLISSWQTHAPTQLRTHAPTQLRTFFLVTIFGGDLISTLSWWFQTILKIVKIGNHFNFPDVGVPTNQKVFETTENFTTCWDNNEIDLIHWCLYSLPSLLRCKTPIFFGGRKSDLRWTVWNMRNSQPTFPCLKMRFWSTISFDSCFLPKIEPFHNNGNCGGIRSVVSTQLQVGAETHFPLKMMRRTFKFGKRIFPAQKKHNTWNLFAIMHGKQSIKCRYLCVHTKHQKHLKPTHWEPNNIYFYPGIARSFLQIHPV